jgi:hypothetical protein
MSPPSSGSKKNQARNQREKSGKQKIEAINEVICSHKYPD